MPPANAKPPQQRTTEWLDATSVDHQYHVRQFETPYRSTVAFAGWLKHWGVMEGSRHVADLGCGMGAALSYIAESFPETRFTGIDLNGDVLEEARSRIKLDNVEFVQGDLFHLDKARHSRRYSGLLSIQTLSWLPGAEAALSAMSALEAGWMALSSLFYDGPVDTTITVRDYSAPLASQAFTEAFYNVYSLPKIREIFANLGFGTVEAEPFVIDIDLPRPEGRGMGTYTERMDSGERIQRSGPLLMPWYFVLARR